MLNIKDKNTIIKEIETYIQSRFPTADLTPNTVLRDLAIEAPATYLYEHYALLSIIDYALDLGKLKDLLSNTDNITKLANITGISIEELSRLFKDIIELYATNYGITRKPGYNATGLLTFYVTELPNNTSIDIPAGTICSVNGGEPKFATLYDIKIDPSSFNINTNRYEVSVLAECKSIGTIGNVAQNTINTIDDTKITASVINPDIFKGGINSETDLELLDRISLAYTGNFQGTADSIIKKVLSYNFVSDVYISYLPDDPYKISDGLNNIDIYVKSFTSFSNNEIIPKQLSFDNTIPFSKRFVSTVLSVKGYDNDINNKYVFNPNLYELRVSPEGNSFLQFNLTFERIINTESDLWLFLSNGLYFFLNNNSIKGQIKINNIPLVIPNGHYTLQIKRINKNTLEEEILPIPYSILEANNTIINFNMYKNWIDLNTYKYIIMCNFSLHNYIEVDYIYNNSLEVLYNDLNNPANLFLGQHINVFQAQQVPIIIKATVQIKQGYSLEDKKNECLNKLNNYISSLPMGAEINESDIIYQLKSIEGVIDVRIPLTALTINSKENKVSDIKLEKIKYGILSSESEIITQYTQIINR